jgi:hypothetical protein
VCVCVCVCRARIGAQNRFRDYFKNRGFACIGELVTFKSWEDDGEANAVHAHDFRQIDCRSRHPTCCMCTRYHQGNPYQMYAVHNKESQGEICAGTHYTRVITYRAHSLSDT